MSRPTIRAVKVKRRVQQKKDIVKLAAPPTIENAQERGDEIKRRILGEDFVQTKSEEVQVQSGASTESSEVEVEVED